MSVNGMVRPCSCPDQRSKLARGAKDKEHDILQRKPREPSCDARSDHKYGSKREEPTANIFVRLPPDSDNLTDIRDRQFSRQFRTLC